MTGERALDLPALPVDSLEESDLHLTAVPGPGPLPTATTIQGKDARTDLEILATQSVVVLGVVSRIPQHAIKANEVRRIPHRGRELRRILRRSHADVGAWPQVSLAMADDGEFGPMKPGVA